MSEWIDPYSREEAQYAVTEAARRLGDASLADANYLNAIMAERRARSGRPVPQEVGGARSPQSFGVGAANPTTNPAGYTERLNEEADALAREMRVENTFAFREQNAAQITRRVLEPRISIQASPRDDGGLNSYRQAATQAQERAVGFRAARVTAIHDTGLHDVLAHGRAYEETGIGVMGSTHLIEGDTVVVLDSGYLSKPQTLGQSSWVVG